MERSNVERMLDKVINTSADEAHDLAEKVVKGTEEMLSRIAGMQTQITDLQTDPEDLTLGDVKRLLEFLHQWAAELEDWNALPDLADQVLQFVQRLAPTAAAA